MDIMIQYVAVAIGAMGFAFKFNIRGKKLVVAAAGGLLGWVVYTCLNMWLKNDYWSCLASAAIVTLYAEIMARILKTPVTVVIVPAIIPLIPGASLYKTMDFLMKNDWESFGEQSVYTIVFSVCIAVGIIAITVIFETFAKYKKQ